MGPRVSIRAESPSGMACRAPAHAKAASGMARCASIHAGVPSGMDLLLTTPADALKPMPKQALAWVSASGPMPQPALEWVLYPGLLQTRAKAPLGTGRARQSPSHAASLPVRCVRALVVWAPNALAPSLHGFPCNEGADERETIQRSRDRRPSHTTSARMQRGRGRSWVQRGRRVATAAASRRSRSVPRKRPHAPHPRHAGPVRAGCRAAPTPAPASTAACTGRGTRRPCRSCPGAPSSG